MATASLRALQQSEKNKKWLGLDKASDRIPGLIEMVVEGDDFILSGGAKNLLVQPPKAATGTFVATGLIIGDVTYTKAQLTTITKSGKAWKKAPAPALTNVLRQVRALHNQAVKKKTGRSGNDQLLILNGPNFGVGIGKVEKTAKLGGQAGGNPTGSPPSSIKMQESVTLAIFKILLGPNSYKGPPGAKGSRITSSMLKNPEIHTALENDFDKICMGTLSRHRSFNLSKIWPGLKGVKDSSGNMVPGAKLPNSEGGDVKMREWYYHFLLQFEQVESATDLPDDVFDMFTYDDFLQFIEKLVLSGPPTEAALDSATAFTSTLTVDASNRREDKTWPAFGVIPKKDSWNPADIWLVNTYHPKYPQTILKLKQSQTIMEINKILMDAFRSRPRMIVGISLKKSDALSHSAATHVGARLHYDLINFHIKGKIPELNPVRYKDLVINLPWDKTRKEFTVITNTLEVNEMKRKPTKARPNNFKVHKVAEMRIGSGQSGTHNINIEYKPKKGGGQLGKVPKTLLPGLIQKITSNTGYELPTWKAAEDAIPHSNRGTKYNNMKALVKKVNDCSLFTFKNKTEQMGNFIEHIIEAKNDTKKWKKDSATHKSVTMAVQMMMFYGTLVDIYGISKPDKRRFNKFLKNSYNLAQKRGETTKSEFGPFGKLH